MADVYVMCGVPGSGKSTFLKERIIGKNRPNTVVISRDEIRFSLVKEEENYFSKEKQVTENMWAQINVALQYGMDVFVDQTSLTKKSRNWLLQHIDEYDHAYLIWIDTPLEVCIGQNKQRKGRNYVPEDVIENMFNNFEEPSLIEGFTCIFRYNTINKKWYKQTFEF